MRLLRTIALASMFLTGLGFTTLGLVALKHPLSWEAELTPRHWVQGRVAGGNVSLTYAVRGDRRGSNRRGVRLMRGGLGTLAFFRGQDRRWAWTAVTVPLGLTVGVLVVPSGLGLIRGPILRRRRLTRGECENCGYDLRGSAGRYYPECGKYRASCCSNR